LLPAAVWVVIATAAQLARQPGVPAHDTIWAEDGKAFLADALHSGPLTPLFRPLAGYMHLAPRLIAGAAALVPLRMASRVLAVGPALVVALLSVYIFSASRWILPAPWARAVLAALYVFLPDVTFESANCIANLHFYLPLPAFVALLDRPGRLRDAIPGIAVVLVATMSDARLVLLLPLAVALACTQRSVPEKAISCAFIAGLAVQAAVVFQARVLGTDTSLPGYPLRFGESSIWDALRLYAVRVVDALLIGDRLLDNAWRLLGWGLAVVGIVVLVTGAAVGLARAGRTDRLWITLALGLSAGFFAIYVVPLGTRYLWPHEPFYLSGNRYVQIPMLFLILAVLMILGGRSAELGAAARAVRDGVLLLLSLVVIVNFAPAVIRSAGPSWSGEVAAARAHCRAHPDGSVEIQTAPHFSDPNIWTVPMTCRQLASR
jgi:hypothetical protein